MLKAAIEKKDVTSMNNLGILYMKQGKYVQSKEYLRMALENGYEDSKQPLRDLEDMGY